MRFIGCKKNLLPFLDSVVRETGVSDGVFCDLFAGTAAVGKHFKRAGFAVMSTDLLYFSFVLQKAHVEINAPPAIVPSKHKHIVANEDALAFAEKTKQVTLLYLDPPYNARQYAPNYHILETIARADSPPLRGVSGLRDYAAQKSEFCSRKTALRALSQIIEAADYQHLVLSYNEDGIMPDDEIMRLLKRHGKVAVMEKDYARYKSNNGGSGRTRVKERAYRVKRVHPKNALNDLSGDAIPRRKFLHRASRLNEMRLPHPNNNKSTSGN